MNSESHKVRFHTQCQQRILFLHIQIIIIFLFQSFYNIHVKVAPVYTYMCMYSLEFHTGVFRPVGYPWDIPGPDTVSPLQAKIDLIIISEYMYMYIKSTNCMGAFARPLQLRTCVHVIMWCCPFKHFFWLTETLTVPSPLSPETKSRKKLYTLHSVYWYVVDIIFFPNSSNLLILYRMIVISS